MKLLIISHTEHYVTEAGTVVGWGPTVTEINHLTDLFEEITHIGMLHKGTPPPSALPYTSQKIQFIPLPALGGKTLLTKLNIIWKAPKVLKIVRKALKDTDYFQFRAPTGIGVYVIPYLNWFSGKKGWYKYAGNWVQEDPPMGYRWQRWFLKRQRQAVTINGSWHNQPKHCLSFENPCLTDEELVRGIKERERKMFNKPITFCFVGRLEEAKGLDVLIEAISLMSLEERKKIAKIHLVGEGEKRDYYESLVKQYNLPFVFHGFLSRKNVFEIYRQSHAILLPSKSEGFPKVLAEAMNFGCIPIVSNISSINQYIINHKTGFLLDSRSAFDLIKSIEEVLNLTNDEYETILFNQKTVLRKFTYSKYNCNIKDRLLS